MKRTLTAVIVLATAAGFAGLVQAQTTNTATTTPSNTAPSTYSTAPSATAPSAAVPSATAPSTTSAANPSPAPQASMQQPASGNSFWSRNISEDEVRQAQQQLQAQGLYRGPIDGKVGSEMHRALARYQQQNGLRQTGTLDEQTVARIGGGAGPAIGSTTPPGSAAAPAGSGSMTGGAPTGGTAASPSTTSPIGAGGTSTTTPTTAPSTSGTQPVTR